MKLIRAICDCGFHSQKARLGYHFHQWWFPIFERKTGLLYDIRRALPEDQVELIQWSKMPAAELHGLFVEQTTRELIQHFHSQADQVFNPTLDEVFHCPQCKQQSLRILPVHVTAFCKDECGHEYSWHDTEERGCPRCNYRPHQFRTDEENYFEQESRTVSSCSCSSCMDSALPTDAYCPKCGELPVRYQKEDRSICGKHHLVLLPYKMPGDYLFTQPLDIWRKTESPNAKHWGDSAADDALDSSYCTACEKELQEYLAAEDHDAE